MKPEEIKRIRDKFGFTREEFASILCLSGYKAYANLENDIRRPSKLTIRFLRYVDSLSKAKALAFIEEFNCHETK